MNRKLARRGAAVVSAVTHHSRSLPDAIGPRVSALALVFTVPSCRHPREWRAHGLRAPKRGDDSEWETRSPGRRTSTYWNERIRASSRLRAPTSPISARSHPVGGTRRASASASASAPRCDGAPGPWQWRATRKLLNCSTARGGARKPSESPVRDSLAWSN